jgi:hypothetical protein
MDVHSIIFYIKSKKTLDLHLTVNIKMISTLRRSDFGHLQSATMQLVYENNSVKAYGSYKSLVPEGYFLVTCILLNASNYFTFGDAFGELVFLAAISHPTDRSTLPTSLMCMDANAFKSWLSPPDGTNAVEPQKEHFCLNSTTEFLKENEKVPQISLLGAGAAVFPTALKVFLRFMIETLKRDGDDFREHFLGIGCNPPPSEPQGKADLSEEEKIALMGGRSERLLAKARVDYTYSNKIPLGAIDVSLKSTSKKDPPSKKGPPKKHPPQPKDPAPQKYPSPIIVPKTNSRKTKAQLEEELVELRKLQKVGGQVERASLVIASKPPTMPTEYSTASTSMLKIPTAVATPTMDLAASRAERDKDFDQTIKQVGKFFDFARGYAGELQQMNQATM